MTVLEQDPDQPDYALGREYAVVIRVLATEYYDPDDPPTLENLDQRVCDAAYWAVRDRFTEATISGVAHVLRFYETAGGNANNGFADLFERLTSSDNGIVYGYKVIEKGIT